MTESKSMLEVWEWKEAVYNDIKNMTKEEVLKYYEETANKIISKMGYKKQDIKKNAYKLVKI